MSTTKIPNVYINIRFEDSTFLRKISGLLLLKNLLTSMLVKILQSAMMDFYCVINLFYIILEAQRLEAEISWHVDQTDEENM